MNDVITLCNAGLIKHPDETYFSFATRAAAEHERRRDPVMAQRWRDARWYYFDGYIRIMHGRRGDWGNGG